MSNAHSLAFILLLLLWTNFNKKEITYIAKFFHMYFFLAIFDIFKFFNESFEKKKKKKKSGAATRTQNALYSYSLPLLQHSLLLLHCLCSYYGHSCCWRKEVACDGRAWASQYERGPAPSPIHRPREPSTVAPSPWPPPSPIWGQHIWSQLI